MKIAVFYSGGTFFASTIEDNGDEHRLTQAATLDGLLADIESKGLAGTPIEYDQDVPR